MLVSQNHTHTTFVLVPRKGYKIYRNLIIFLGLPWIIGLVSGTDFSDAGYFTLNLLLDLPSLLLVSNTFSYHIIDQTNGRMTATAVYGRAEYVQRRVYFVNVQSSLHENVVFSVCACMCNAVLYLSFPV